jgi:cytochrome c oxidase cbb3-type subunit 2
MECWKCHGQQGRGDGPSAATLTDSKDQPIRPYNFADARDDSRFKCGGTNDDLYRIFMTGLDGTPMPSFADNIQPNDAWDLVHFLRTLQVHRHSKENKPPAHHHLSLNCALAFNPHDSCEPDESGGN